MKPIKIGIEIECLVNDDIFKINNGDYHHGRSVPGLPGWKAENDSSVHTDRFGEVPEWNGDATEFVSNTVCSKAAFFKQLKSFEDYFSKKGELQLKQSLRFNSSCGAHVHFSVKDLKFKQKTIWKIFRETRNLFMKLLSESDIEFKEDIKRHYYRSYSKRCSRGNYLYGRCKEFNFESESQDKGLEWRSINLHNLKTWNEFNKFWNIVWTCLQFLEESAQKYTEQRTMTIKPEKEALKGMENTQMEFEQKENVEFKTEEIMLREDKLFSKEGEPPESDEMVALRLKYLSNIENVQKAKSNISTENIIWARHELHRQNILVNEDLEVSIPNGDGLYDIWSDIDDATVSVESEIMYEDGYCSPTTQTVKRLLLENKIRIIRLGNQNQLQTIEEEGAYYFV